MPSSSASPSVPKAPPAPPVNVAELKNANFPQLLEKTMISSSEIVNSGSLKKQVSDYMVSSLNNKSHSASNTKRTIQQIISTAINTRATEKEKDVLKWVQFCVETCLSQQEQQQDGSSKSRNSDKLTATPISEQQQNKSVSPTKKPISPKKNHTSASEDNEDDYDDDYDSIGYHVIGASDDDYVPSDDDDDSQEVPDSANSKKPNGDDDQQVPATPPKKKKDDKKKPTRRKKEEDQPPFIQPHAGSKAVLSYFSTAHPIAASEKNGLSSGHFAKSYFFPSKESFNAFISVLNSAQKTIDVCVFSLTDDDVADALIAAKERKVDIRIITDNQQAAGVGADAARLQKDHGIPYKTDHTTGYMHNKFAVVDSKTLINGSFNWSKGARFKNRENIMITNLPYLIKEFQAQFEALWEEF
ncbi:hypothetical protein BCR42DRAFT_320634 [Absidia repens]|uniref:Mitochondrial cardiolipin hydrolase n=1 Tax=Absidia repens TaxID=90262 RepID=A0A1X2IRC3_9FUNG|nr:hypothetical protein BCR42DRAFT_320634 [Absidia repens]